MAVTVNVAACPAVTVSLTGCPVIVGATVVEASVKFTPVTFVVVIVAPRLVGLNVNPLLLGVTV